MDNITTIEAAVATRPGRDGPSPGRPPASATMAEVLRHYGLSILEFLWLEVTAECNNHCLHCYASTTLPGRGPGALGTADHRRLLSEAAALGCRKVQFIGGEPMLDPGLPGLIEAAVSAGYQFIEVFTNLTVLPRPAFEVMKKRQVSVATSFYSFNPQTHDGITGTRGSHRRTSTNNLKVAAAGLPLRVGIIVMPQNAAAVEETQKYVASLGASPSRVHPSPARGIGRGEQVVDNRNNLTQQLCGECWKGSICVSPAGEVYPCIMSRHLAAGNVRETSLEEIVRSPLLARHREEIYREVFVPREEAYEQNRRQYAVRTSLEGGCLPASECAPRCLPSGLSAWL